MTWCNFTVEVTERVLEKIAQSGMHNTLTTLDLFDSANFDSDQAAQHLCQLVSQSNHLERLDLSKQSGERWIKVKVKYVGGEDASSVSCAESDHDDDGAGEGPREGADENSGVADAQTVAAGDETISSGIVIVRAYKANVHGEEIENLGEICRRQTERVKSEDNNLEIAQGC